MRILQIVAFFVAPATALYSFSVKLKAGVSQNTQRTKLYITGDLDKSVETSSGGTSGGSANSSMLIVDAERVFGASLLTVVKSSAKLPLVAGRRYLLRAVCVEYEKNAYGSAVSGAM
jgi:hypothetical protein